MVRKVNCLFRFLTVVLFLFCFVPSVFTATIDVMIVYDSTAKSWVDNNGGMNAFAADAVARMNQAAANSNVDLVFRLVYAAQASYTSTGTLSTDLTNLRTGVGNLSVVDGWRDTYGADLVAMLVDTGSAYGAVGIGYLLSTYSGSPGYAFTVSAIRSVDISHTLTHEVGHNLGCHHSKYQTQSPGPNTDLNSYSAGWYFTGTNATAYHTIMAYNDQNGDGYADHSEAPLFSAPWLFYQGGLAGNSADGDNSRTIRETMNVVASYRAAIDNITISPESADFGDSGGTGSIMVTTSWNGVSWTATSNVSWMTITSGASGTGNKTITYSVAANLTNSTRVGTITIERMSFVVTQTASGSILYADLGTLGLWKHDGTSWTRLAPENPENIAASGSILYADLGTLGLWKHDGTSWTRLAPENPENIAASGSILYADLGTLGLWKHDGTSWTRLAPENPENIAASGSILYADLGTLGLWKHDGTSWTRLAPENPENIAASGSILYADFGTLGLWKHDGTSWTKLAPENPENIAASGSILYADLGTLGLWKHDGTSWTRLAPENPENIAASGSILYADLGTLGLWKHDGTSWTRLAPENPENIAASSSILYADFGTLGLWKHDGTSWTRLAPENPENIAVGF
jgi:hypothetical protein